MSLLTVLLIVAGVGYVLIRRVLGSLLEVKGLLILPAVLTVIGFFSVKDATPMDATTVAFVGLGIVISVALGVVRGTTVHLGERGGELWMRYTAGSVGLWVLNIALKGALVPVERAVSGASADAADSSIMFAIGLGILAESAVVVLRAMHTKAELVWEKGEDGEPHRGSPALDRAREFVTSGGLDRATLRRGLVRRDW